MKRGLPRANLVSLPRLALAVSPGDIQLLPNRRPLSAMQLFFKITSILTLGSSAAAGLSRAEWLVGLAAAGPLLVIHSGSLPIGQMAQADSQ